MTIMDNGYNYTHIASNTTTAIRTGPCILHAISVNSAGASSNVATVYDDVAGGTSTVVGVVFTVPARSIVFDVILRNGLQIVTATGTAGDLTVCWTPLGG